MKLSEELAWRGFVNQTTYKDISILDGKPITFYWGVDPSASSMTVGNFAAAMMVRHFIDHGHKAILLVGGATGLIGDPDGKKEERDLKSLEEIDKNIAGISAQYKTIFAGKPFEIVNNHDWFKDIGYMDFLRDIGKHLSMTQLLDREFVQSRIGEGGAGISYAEFSYSLIQGYDFLHLFREKGVTLQVSGADQWGNSLAGVEMIRKLEGGEAHVYTTPLVTNKSTGVKFGKTESGAVWLDPDATSVYKFYQFWLNVDDEGVEDYLKIYTFLEKSAIEELMTAHRSEPGARKAQKALAKLVTSIVHGGEKAQQVEDITRMLFGEVPFNDLMPQDLDVLAEELPVTETTSLVEALVHTKLASSNGDARRLIASGAVSVNGQKVDESTAIAKPALIKKGKNSFALVR